MTLKKRYVALPLLKYLFHQISTALFFSTFDRKTLRVGVQSKVSFSRFPFIKDLLKEPTTQVFWHPGRLVWEISIAKIPVLWVPHFVELGENG